jgi:hypothetical protein
LFSSLCCEKGLRPSGKPLPLNTNDMNKKRDPSEVRNIHYLVRLNKNEQGRFLKRLEEANGMKPSDFIRAMICNGYVQAPIKRSERFEARELLRLLLEYKSNFRRISNLIKYKEPALHQLVQSTAKNIQKVIDMI